MTIKRTFRTLAIALLIEIACALPAASSAFATERPTPRMEYLDNGIIRVGVDLSIGGSITYLADSKNQVNMINSHDWGRQVQMSFYGDPRPYIPPSGKQPHKRWAGLGWNPIQSGDVGGYASKVLDYENDGQSIYVKCIPMHWPHYNVPGECTFESWLSLDGNAVVAKSRLNNNRPDKTRYRARDQECPAVYSNGPWHRVVTYTGTRPFTGDKVDEVPQKDGQPPWSGFYATESWAALVNDNGDGLGIWTPGAHRFTGGFHGARGKGGPKDGATGYVAPLFIEILDHNIQYTYEYRLIVGDVKTIRKYVYEKNTGPVTVFDFSDDRQHWTYQNAIDTGWPVEGGLQVKLEQDQPRLISPRGCWRAEKITAVEITAAFMTGETMAHLSWQTMTGSSARPSRSADGSVEFEVKPDGQFRTYRVELAGKPGYEGAITRFIIAPCSKGGPGRHVKVKRIELSNGGG